MDKQYQVGDLRVWWKPQVPMNSSFYVDVDSALEGKKLIDTLAKYDIYQYRKNIKPDFCNAGGLQMFVGVDVDYETSDGWVDWESADGESIDDLSFEELAKLDYGENDVA